MRLFIYCVFDTCSGVYDRPMCARTDAEMIRSFGHIASDASHPIGKNPEHFQLHRVGTFDDNTAVIVPEDGVCLAKAHELVAAGRQIAPGSLQKDPEVLPFGDVPDMNGEEHAS